MDLNSFVCRKVDEEASLTINENSFRQTRNIQIDFANRFSSHKPTRQARAYVNLK